MLMWTANHPQMLHKREQRAMAHVVGHPRTACVPNWFTINSPQLPSLCALPLASPVASWRTLSRRGGASFSLSSRITLWDIWKLSFHSSSQNSFRTTLFYQLLRFLPSSRTSLWSMVPLRLAHKSARRQLVAWLLCDSVISCVRSCKKLQQGTRQEWYDCHFTEEQEKGGGNSSAQTDLCDSILNMHTATCKLEQQRNIYFHWPCKWLNGMLSFFLSKG